MKKNLIIATGFSKVLLTRWLPLLRGVGGYQDDVVCLDYDVISYSTPEVIGSVLARETLAQQPNVTVIHPEKMVMRNIFLDRLYQSREYLKKNAKKYKVVMLIDGNDSIFWGSIQPLLKIAETNFCAVQEHESNKLRIWDDFSMRDFIKSEFWGISDNPIINGGMVVAPTAKMLEYLDYQMDMIQVYGDVVSDQCYLVLFLYYYKYPHLLLGNEWNYTHAVIGWDDKDRKVPSRRVVIKDGKAYKVEDGTPVYIEHRTGTGWRFFKSKTGMQLLRDPTVPVSIMAEYLWEDSLNKGTSLFPAYDDEDPARKLLGLPMTLCKKPLNLKKKPFKGTWLFPTDNSRIEDI
jgi:hypothetical protein